MPPMSARRYASCDQPALRAASLSRASSSSVSLTVALRVRLSIRRLPSRGCRGCPLRLPSASARRCLLVRDGFPPPRRRTSQPPKERSPSPVGRSASGAAGQEELIHVLTLRGRLHRRRHAARSGCARDLAGGPPARLVVVEMQGQRGDVWAVVKMLREGERQLRGSVARMGDRHPARDSIPKLASACPRARGWSRRKARLWRSRKHGARRCFGRFAGEREALVGSGSLALEASLARAQGRVPRNARAVPARRTPRTRPRRAWVP